MGLTVPSINPKQLSSGAPCSAMASAWSEEAGGSGSGDSTVFTMTMVVIKMIDDTVSNHAELRNWLTKSWDEIAV